MNNIKHICILMCATMCGCSLYEPDGCPNDPIKDAPGLCGCNRVEVVFTKANGELSCDYCNGNAAAQRSSSCDCSDANVLNDADNDGTVDCLDACPDDPKIVTETEKQNAGGCGKTPVGNNCENDPNGCIDGPAENSDACPDDPDKTEPGICGCGYSDADTDADTVADCVDVCIYNASIQTADQVGDCGCEATCNPCPAGSLLESKGLCGCNIEAVMDGENKNIDDTDKDGVLDCIDICPNNPSLRDSLADIENLSEYLNSADYKALAERCKYKDTDGDGILDDADPCPTHPDIEAAANSCNANSLYGEHTFVIRHAIDFATLRKELANHPTDSYVILFDSRDKKIDMGYDYLDVTDVDGSQIHVGSNGSCTIDFVPIDLNNASVDGKNHVITASYNGMRCTINQPLFGTVNQSSIKDLTLNFDVTGEGRGILANEMTGNSHIENIQVVDSTIVSSSDQAVGGIVGTITGDDALPSDSFVDVKNCTANRVTVKAPAASAAGGLFGKASKTIIQFPESVEITTVEGKDNVGGIVGYGATPTPSGTINHKFILKPLTEDHKIRATVGRVSGDVKVGGFIGFFENKLGNKLDLSNIITQVTSVHGKEKVGGFAGSINAYYMYLRNIGHSVESVEGSGNMVGGFGGSIHGFQLDMDTIKNAVGSVVGSDESDYIGGFAGEIYSQNLTEIKIIQNDVNLVKGNNYVSGLFAKLELHAMAMTDDNEIAIESECKPIQIVQSTVQTVEAKNAHAAGLVALLDLSHHDDAGYFRLQNVSSMANVIVDHKANASACTSSTECSNIGGMIAEVYTKSGEGNYSWIFLRNVVTSTYLFGGTGSERERIHFPMIVGGWGNYLTGADVISMYTPYELSDTTNRDLDCPYYSSSYGIGYTPASSNHMRLRPSMIEQFITDLNNTDSVKNDNSFSWKAAKFTFETETTPTSLPGVSIRNLPTN